MIVITTKKAQTEKLSIDFNADITSTNKTDYSSLDLCNASEMLEKQVKLIFCNFHEVKYDPDVHVSESLAHKLISLGYKDEDDVTQAVKEIYNIK